MKLLILAAALVSSTIATSAIAQSNLIILTGSTSGVYYPLGSALSSIYMKSIPGIRTRAVATQGSVENLRLLHAGDGELAFSLGDTVSAAWKGNPEAGFPAPLSHLRGVAAIYSNHVQIVASETSAAKALTDLKGKRVSVGPKQSGTELNARAIFAAAGIRYGDFARTDYLPFGQSAKMIEQGELDATLQSAGLGVDSIRHLSTAVPIKMLAIPRDTVLKIGDPAYVPSVIPARTYEGQVEPVETAAIINFLVTRDGVSADVVYAMTKSLFASLDQLVQIHPAARGISLQEALTGLPLPLHPGAERYYREVGLLK
jgi:TRAP transporter TAXI family solute receptor